MKSRLRRFSTAINRRRFEDEGDWLYASEWWVGDSASSRTVFRETSRHGNGVVSVLSHPSSKPVRLSLYRCMCMFSCIAINGLHWRRTGFSGGGLRNGFSGGTMRYFQVQTMAGSSEFVAMNGERSILTTSLAKAPLKFWLREEKRKEEEMKLAPCALCSSLVALLYRVISTKILSLFNLRKLIFTCMFCIYAILVLHFGFLGRSWVLALQILFWNCFIQYSIILTTVWNRLTKLEL